MQVYEAVQERKSTVGQWVAVWGAALLMLLVFSVMAGSAAEAATYYMAVSGSDSSSGTSAAPFGTFAKAMGVLKAGDTLLIKDGTYNQSLTVTVSGTAASPIAIKAVNDGAVIVDGQGTREPLKIAGRSYINVEGIVFKNAVYDVIKVSGGSNHINLRRLSAYNAGVGNYHLFLIWNSNTVLVEDCIASQTKGTNKAGRYGFVSFSGANHNTFRRNYMKYYAHTGGGGPCAAGADYGGSYDLWENNVFDVSEMPAGCSDVDYQFVMFGEGLYNDTSHNQWHGNVAIGGPNTNKAVLAETDGAAHSVNNWEFHNNVFLNARTGITNIGAADGTGWIFQNNTVVGMSSTATLWSNGSGANIATTGNSFLSGPNGVKTSNSGALTSRYNNFSAITTQYSGTISDKTGDKNIIPSYDTFTYGKGAYLMVPDALQGQGANGADMGAEVLYRSENGAVTGTPLWPWSMEDRYFQETGRSITWEANGGLWKTLDGVYAAAPVTAPVTPPADTTVPSTPAGLTATAVSSSQINLSWNVSTDNTGVAGYRVYKSGNLIATVTGTTYSDTGLLPSTIYSYSVAAFDAAGNASALSVQVSATTKASTVPAVPGEIIIDNGTAGTSSTGTWAVSGATGAYGANSLWSRDGATYTWKASLPQSGTYKVYMQWSAYSSRATNAPVTVAYNGGTKTVAVNQQLNGGTWNLIGTYSFDAAKGGSVTLSAPNASPTSYCADAVKFVYTPTVTPAAEIIVDNGAAGTSSTGTWTTSSGTGSYGGNSLWSRNGATYTWKASLPQSGTYNVYMWWSAYSSRSTSAPVTVAYNGGSKTVAVNQQLNGGTWNLIGTYSFDAAKGGSVTLSAPNPTPTSYSADAVKFVSVP